MSRLSTKQRRAARRRHRAIRFRRYWNDLRWAPDQVQQSNIILGQRSGKSYVMAEMRRLAEERKMGVIKNIGKNGAFAIVSVDEASSESLAEAILDAFRQIDLRPADEPLTATEISIRSMYREKEG